MSSQPAQRLSSLLPSVLLSYASPSEQEFARTTVMCVASEIFGDLQAKQSTQAPTESALHQNLTPLWNVENCKRYFNSTVTQQ